MKKVLIIVGIVFLVLIALFPVKGYMMDGGTVLIKPIIGTYEVYDYHRITGNTGEDRYLVGKEIKVFGIKVYKNTKIVVEKD